MRIIEEHYVEDFNDLRELCWSGALDTLDDIENANLEDEFVDYLESVFSSDEEITDTNINDFIWFERDTIYEDLGLDENGQVVEDEEV